MSSPLALPQVMRRSLPLLVALVTVGAGEPFTLPVFPDTQSIVDDRFGKLEMFTKQIEWIVENREAAKIPFVLHVGDIVNFDTVDEHMWKRASEGFAVLDSAGIDYALANGNHDGAAVFGRGSAAPGDTHANVRHTAQFNRYFPVARFSHQVDRFDGRSENAVYAFKAGGLKWLVLALEFCCRQAPLDWAKGVLPRYPDHNVIVLTHYHLTPAGEIAQGNAGYGDLSPQQVFDQLISRYSNIRFVMSGHVVSAATREDRGLYGNRILQVLQNYQSQDHGGGYLRLLEIDPDGGRVSGRMYSPFYGLTKEDSSRFSVDEVEFVRESEGGPGGGLHLVPAVAPEGSGAFEAAFTVVPGASAQDITIALGRARALSRNDYAAAVRLSREGQILARSGADYAAVTPIRYVAGGRYLFQFSISPVLGRYSVKVTDPEGRIAALAADYVFSTEQAGGPVIDTMRIDTDPNGGGRVHVSPVLFHQAIVERPLAIAQEASLSGTREEVVGGRTTDGDRETYWVPPDGIGWIRYDLGSVRTISKLRLAWREMSARGFHFDLQASTNLNTQWMPLLSGLSADGKASDWDEIDVPDIAARYIRLSVRYGNPEDGSGLAEAEVWGF